MKETLFEVHFHSRLDPIYVSGKNFKEAAIKAESTGLQLGLPPNNIKKIQDDKGNCVVNVIVMVAYDVKANIPTD